jgi:hypothetical protein
MNDLQTWLFVLSVKMKHKSPVMASKVIFVVLFGIEILDWNKIPFHGVW